MYTVSASSGLNPLAWITKSPLAARPIISVAFINAAAAVLAGDAVAGREALAVDAAGIGVSPVIVI